MVLSYRESLSKREGDEMGIITKDLLINFLFILLPLFLLQMIYLLKIVYRIDKLKDFLVTILSMVSIILCMLFPFFSGGRAILGFAENSFHHRHSIWKKKYCFYFIVIHAFDSLFVVGSKYRILYINHHFHHHVDYPGWSYQRGQ